MEEDHQLSKQVSGLDSGQVTTWTSWHRWTAISLLACAFLAVAAACQRARDGSGSMLGLIPVTAPELLRQLRGTVIPEPRRDNPHHDAWTLWRRRHQYHAQQAHQRWHSYATRHRANDLQLPKLFNYSRGAAAGTGIILERMADDPVEQIAWAVAAQLEAEFGPRTETEVEAALCARAATRGAEQYDLVAIGALIVAIVQFAYSVYSDHRKKSPDASPEAAEHLMRTEISREFEITDTNTRITDVVVMQIIDRSAQRLSALSRRALAACIARDWQPLGGGTQAAIHTRCCHRFSPDLSALRRIR